MNLKKYTFFLLGICLLAGTFWSCSDDEGATPIIRYIRVTDPVSSDSLLVKAGQGQMIAIMGENLGGVRQIWFNNQQAVLTPTFITNTTVITRVPSEIPTEITNKLTMIFANGQTLDHDFTVDISEPQIDYMKSEYVNAGDVAIISGDYFYEPLTVTFTGGATGEIVSVEDDLLEVRVPDGAQPGPITVTTNFGSTESTFWFRDNRNMIASFDGTTNGWWHGSSYVMNADEKITAIAGKFIRVNRELGPWAWFEMYVGPANSDVALELKNIPEEAISSPSNYSLKFEINTQKSLTGASIRMHIGPNMAGDRNAVNYNWQPNINTNGAWETVTIPWEDVYNANGKFAYNPNGYGISMHFSGPSAVAADFALDNMRVVPNTPE
jgi:hypothetical protein